MRAFAEAYPRESFIDLAERIPPAAAIQVESLLREEVLSNRQHDSFARTVLVRNLSNELLEGWMRGTEIVAV
jgi:hypothetical protein